MVEYKIGNLLDAPVNYICHQVNCQGRMGSGIAKQIRERWPRVYEVYQDWYQGKLYDEGALSEYDMLGHIQIVHNENGPYVINMAAQRFYGYDGKRYTSYDAFWSCLGEITTKVPKGSKIGFPYRIGCGLGGANWQVIETMIYAALDNDYDVYIYMLEE